MLAKIEENGTNPLIKDAIQSTLENTDFIELEYLKNLFLYYKITMTPRQQSH